MMSVSVLAEVLGVVPTTVHFRFTRDCSPLAVCIHFFWDVGGKSDLPPTSAAPASVLPLVGSRWCLFDLYFYLLCLELRDLWQPQFENAIIIFGVDLALVHS